MKWAAPAGGGGGAAWRFYDFPASSFDYPASNPAPLDTHNGANGTIKRHLFDDSTAESIITQIKLPSDLNTAGTVYFEVYGYAVTAAANKSVVWKLYHSAKTAGENWDAAYSSEGSGAKSCDSTQDQLDHHSWNQTVATLGWAVDDFVRIKLERDAADGSDDLVGDYGMILFRLKIPRA